MFLYFLFLQIQIQKRNKWCHKINEFIYYYFTTKIQNPALLQITKVPPSVEIKGVADSGYTQVFFCHLSSHDYKTYDLNALANIDPLCFDEPLQSTILQICFYLYIVIHCCVVTQVMWQHCTDTEPQYQTAVVYRKSVTDLLYYIWSWTVQVWRITFAKLIPPGTL